MHSHQVANNHPQEGENHGGEVQLAFITVFIPIHLMKTRTKIIKKYLQITWIKTCYLTRNK